MIPPGDFFSQHLDLMEHYTGIARSFARAIKQSGVKRVVHLSSIGAHLEGQTGLLLAQSQVEYILEEIPNVDITFLRPAAFYYNLKFFVNMIKNSGIIMSNYGGDDMVLWAAPKDVAQAAAQALESAVAGTIIRYVVSEQISCNDTASILGKAIGKPELTWQIISGEQMFNILTKVGMNPQFAKGLIEMNCRVLDGSLYEDYFQHPSKLGEEKLAGFVREFAAAYYG
ncbi:MAG TPA: NmrA family NAD(P)-binding protein, partial [Arachidicoccus sp.]|nr:NmrA family NAD(P)-binding protein [Arachidicoccus sp.]